MQVYFIYLWQGIGGVVVTIFSLVVAGWLIGLNLLLAINAYRWLALRVKREISKPVKEILKPGVISQIFDRSISVVPEKNGRKAAGK
jgi:hypothetical protein